MAISVARLARLVRYDGETGSFFWRRRDLRDFGGSGRSCAVWNRKYAGARVATCMRSNGYFTVKVCGERILVHRLAVALAIGRWPEVVDHANGVRTDNRLCNLSEVSVAENALNKRPRRDSKTGILGVYPFHGRFRAQIRRGGASYFLGDFDTVEEAAAARRKAQVRLGFHPNHGLPAGATL